MQGDCKCLNGAVAVLAYESMIFRPARIVGAARKTLNAKHRSRQAIKCKNNYTSRHTITVDPLYNHHIHPRRPIVRISHLRSISIHRIPPTNKVEVEVGWLVTRAQPVKDRPPSAFVYAQYFKPITSGHASTFGWCHLGVYDM